MCYMSTLVHYMHYFNSQVFYDIFRNLQFYTFQNMVWQLTRFSPIWNYRTCWPVLCSCISPSFQRWLTPIQFCTLSTWVWFDKTATGICDHKQQRGIRKQKWETNTSTIMMDKAFLPSCLPSYHDVPVHWWYWKLILTPPTNYQGVEYIAARDCVTKNI